MLKEKKSKDNLHPITTYLACQDEIKNYYISLGFTQMDHKSVLHDNNMKVFIDRFDMSDWSKEEINSVQDPFLIQESKEFKV